NFRRDDAEDCARTFSVHEEVRAEARQPGDFIGKVGVVPASKFLPVLLRRDWIEQSGHRFHVEGGRVRFEQLDLAVLPNERWDGGAEVRVGRLVLEHDVEERIDRRGARGYRWPRLRLPWLGRGCLVRRS